MPCNDCDDEARCDRAGLCQRYLLQCAASGQMEASQIHAHQQAGELPIPGGVVAPAEFLLYQHEDGRYAVAMTAEAAKFTLGDPKWHRVGPVAVHGVMVGDAPQQKGGA